MMKGSWILSIFLFQVLHQLGATAFAKGHWTNGTLSVARLGVLATSVGKYALFAGGSNEEQNLKVVDIYDSESKVWSVSSLSEPITSIGSAVVSVGSELAMFTGFQGVIDIFHANDMSWTSAKLSVVRIYLTATSVGNFAFFAGGNSDMMFNLVDIYDASANLWSTANLSQARNFLSSASVGYVALFGGGIYHNSSDDDDQLSNVVDIFDTKTNVWSTASLSVARYGMATTTIGNIAFFAGGTDFSPSGLPSLVVDMYDFTTNKWTSKNVTTFRQDISATTVGNFSMFAGGMTSNNSLTNLINVYDIATKSWSVEYLPYGPRSQQGATSVGNQAFFAGGMVGYFFTAEVNIYTSY